MTADWITAFGAAANNADLAEQRASALSEDAQAALLAWIFKDTTGDTPSTPSAGSSAARVKCTMCGQPAHVPAWESGFEDSGNPLDHMWLCPSDRQRMTGIYARQARRDGQQ